MPAPKPAFLPVKRSRKFPNANMVRTYQRSGGQVNASTCRVRAVFRLSLLLASFL
jgi:hypothetical protein